MADYSLRSDDLFLVLCYVHERNPSRFLVTNWAVGKRVHTFEMHAKGISAFVNPDDKALIYADNHHFIDCIKEDKEPETNFKDAAKTMELVTKIYNSRIC